MPAAIRKQRLLTPRFLLVVLVGLCYFMSLGMQLPVVPVFVEEVLRGGDVAVGVVVGSFSLGAVLLRPFAGLIGDRLGRRVLIVGGAFTVGISTVLYHFADSSALLVWMRILGGLGEAAFFVGAGTMVADLAPQERRGEAISYWSVAVYGGLAFGPFLGEHLMDSGGFGTVWTVSAGLAVAAAMMGLFTRETMATRPGELGERPRPKLLHRSSLAPGLILFMGMVGMAGFFAFVPLYVHEIGLDEARAVFLAYGCTVLAVRIFGARLPDVLGPLRAGTGATSLVAAGLLIMASVPNVAGLYAGTVVFAVGMSLLYPAVLTLALSGVPETERSSSVGTVSSFFDLSEGIGAVILGGVAASTGYRGAFAGGALFALVGLVLLRSGIDPRTRRAVDPAAAEAARGSLEGDPP